MSQRDRLYTESFAVLLLLVSTAWVNARKKSKETGVKCPLSIQLRVLGLIGLVISSKLSLSREKSNRKAGVWWLIRTLSAATEWPDSIASVHGNCRIDRFDRFGRFDSIFGNYWQCRIGRFDRFGRVGNIFGYNIGNAIFWSPAYHVIVSSETANRYSTHKIENSCIFIFLPIDDLNKVLLAFI